MILKDILLKHQYNNKVVIEQSDIAITYAQMYDKVKENSKYLKNFQQDRINIGIYLPNSIDYAIAYFTIAYLDKVIVPIEVQVKKIQMNSTLKYCQIGLIITNTEFKFKLISLLDGINYRISILNLDDRTIEDIGQGNYLDVYNSSNESIPENSVAIMLHTSGTTSNPKRVMLTHKNLIKNVESNIQSLNLTSSDKTLICLPMFFGYCNTSQFLTHYYLGATMVIADTVFIPDKFLKLIQDKQITNSTCVPSMLLLLLKTKLRAKYDVSSLRYLCFGGGIMPVDQLAKLIKKFETIGFVQTYGQTEASPRITCLMPEDALRKIGSVGKPIPNVSLRIVDENGNDVRETEVGEIIIHGENVMKGYYLRPEETDKVKRNGWLHTGDIGRFDEDGYLYLVGRKKNIIISGGLNIYPEEIEEILINHPKIKEVCVIREEHDLLGEVPIAKVVLRENSGYISENEIIKYCTESLDFHKIPTKIIFLDELDKTLTGKVKRN